MFYFCVTCILVLVAVAVIFSLVEKLDEPEGKKMTIMEKANGDKPQKESLLMVEEDTQAK